MYIWPLLHFCTVVRIFEISYFISVRFPSWRLFFASTRKALSVCFIHTSYHYQWLVTSVWVFSAFCTFFTFVYFLLYVLLYNAAESRTVRRNTLLIWSATRSTFVSTARFVEKLNCLPLFVVTVEVGTVQRDVWLGGLVVSALGLRTRRLRFESRVAPLFHWVATLGKLFTHIASPVSQLQETGVQEGVFGS